jgi:hypothetical protein
MTGWQLECLDPGEQTPVHVGTYETLRDAERAAG